MMGARGLDPRLDAVSELIELLGRSDLPEILKRIKAEHAGALERVGAAQSEVDRSRRELVDLRAAADARIADATSRTAEANSLEGRVTAAAAQLEDDRTAFETERQAYATRVADHEAALMAHRSEVTEAARVHAIEVAEARASHDTIGRGLDARAEDLDRRERGLTTATDELNQRTATVAAREEAVVRGREALGADLRAFERRRDLLRSAIGE